MDSPGEEEGLKAGRQKKRSGEENLRDACNENL